MDYKKLQNGSDIRGVALEGIEGQHVNLTETVCKEESRSDTACLRFGQRSLRADGTPWCDGRRFAGFYA